MKDIDQAAQSMRDHIKSQAASYAPGAVLLTVTDGSQQFNYGYVWCLYGDKRVQCIAPANVGDLRTATESAPMMVWALPPNPDQASGYYYLAVGFAQNAASSNGFGPGRIPPLVGSVVNDPTGSPFSGSGTVTSVGLTMPAPFSVAGSPVTTTGTLAVTQPSAFVETQGGTGQSTYTTGDILYASAANTLSKLAKGTAGFFLTIGASIPAWAQVFYQTIKKAGSAVTQRPNLNFIDGSNVTITVADNGGTSATDVTITASAPGGGGVAPATSEIVAWMGLFS